MDLSIFALILTGLNFLALLAVLLSLASIRRELRLLSAGVAKSNRYLRQILKEEDDESLGGYHG